MKIVKQIALSAALAGLFLSAGAFAQSDIKTAPQIRTTNVTVIYKNSNLPRVIFLKSCGEVKCVEV